MNDPSEFHYRIPNRAGGWRPGAHRGSSLGAGQEFVSHVSLYDRPDPRRLDLRASLRDLRGDWLVRVNRQRVSIPVYVIADVSASMRFGSGRTKLEVAADFVTALSQSAFRAGDTLGMLAFDAQERIDLFFPALLSRGMGAVMAGALAQAEGAAGSIRGLEEAAAHLAGSQGLIFLVSDFHWPLDHLPGVLDLLTHAYVVPIVIWDPAESAPPSRNAVIALSDSESGAHRTLWMRPAFRARWQDAVAKRRAEIEAIFGARTIRPFYVTGAFNSDAMSRYFFEATE